jgi:hypothetical protein
MLSSFIATMALLLSGGVNHFASEGAEVDTAAAVESPLYKPEDPSTMTLALIGAGTLAVYFASRRAIRTRRTVTLGEIDRPHYEAVAGAAVLPSAESAKEPSRGAA